MLQARDSTPMNISIIIINKYYKKASLDQDISRASFIIILTYRSLSCPSSTSLTLYWYYLEEIPFLPQYTTPIWNNRFIHFLILLHVSFISPTSLVIKKRNYALIPPLSTVFNFPDNLTNLLSHIHYPRFSFSMPFRLFSLLSSMAFGTYNDVTGNQTNATFHGDYYNFYNINSLTNVPY